MGEVRAQAVRWVSDDFPGWVEVRLVDAAGRAWPLVDNVPAFVDDESLSASADYPVEVALRAVAVATDDAGSVVVRLGHGLEASDGTAQFTVRAEDFSDS